MVTIEIKIFFVQIEFFRHPITVQVVVNGSVAFSIKYSSFIKCEATAYNAIKFI